MRTLCASPAEYYSTSFVQVERCDWQLKPWLTLLHMAEKALWALVVKACVRAGTIYRGKIYVLGHRQ